MASLHPAQLRSVEGMSLEGEGAEGLQPLPSSGDGCSGYRGAGRVPAAPAPPPVRWALFARWHFPPSQRAAILHQRSRSIFLPDNEKVFSALTVSTDCVTKDLYQKWEMSPIDE